MGRKIRVFTTCGGEYVYDLDQEVESVEIVETKTKNLNIIRQEDLKGRGHWHLEDECGYQVGNICTDGLKIIIGYHGYDEVSVELVNMVENWT